MKTCVPLTLVVLMLAVAGCRVLAQNRLVMCVYTSVSSYHMTPFYPNQINPAYCTHLIFAYAELNSQYSIRPQSGNDLQLDALNESLYTELNDFKKKKPTLKTLLAVGGPAVDPIRFSQMTARSTLREIFVESCVTFLTEHGFDGLLLDWEFPATQDKANLTLLVRELSTAFQGNDPKLLLAVAVGKNSSAQLEGYDVSSLNQNADYIVVMAYDFHGPWESVTGHNSALYSSSTDDDSLSVSTLVQNWVSKGMPAGKMVLGLATYGRTFKLAHPAKFKVGDLASGTGKAGQITVESGYMAYYEICKALKKDSVRMFDKESKVPYAFSRKNWISYEDPQSLRYKLTWLVKNGLAGAVIWSVGVDDIVGDSCGQDKFPLTRVISGCLMNGTKCAPDAGIGLPSREMTVMCYYTNWAQFRGDRRFYPEDIDPFLCTHLVFAFANLDNSNIEPSLWNDVTKTEIGDCMYTRFNDLKKKEPKVKTLLSVGGTPEAANNFSLTVSTPLLRQLFVVGAINILKKYGFDGLDISWNFPAIHDPNGTSTDKENFVALLQDLNNAFDEEVKNAEAKVSRLLLTATVGAPYDIVKNGYDVPELSKLLDFLTLKTSDLHGYWDGATGHSAALYTSSTDKQNLSVSDTANNWMKLGASRHNFLIWLPFYGRTFKLTDPNDHGLGAAVSGPGQKAKDSGKEGFMTYFEVVDAVRQHGYTVEFDNVAKAPYAYKGYQWISFENADSLLFKMAWLDESGFAGVSIYALDFDDFDGRSLSAGAYPLTRVVSDCFKKRSKCMPLPGYVSNANVFYTSPNDAGVSACSTCLFLMGVVTAVVLRT